MPEHELLPKRPPHMLMLPLMPTAALRTDTSRTDGSRLQVSKPDPFTQTVQVARLLKTPSAMCCVLQGVAGSLPWGVLLTFINDYLSQQQRLSVAQATLVRLVLQVGPVGASLGVLAII